MNSYALPGCCRPTHLALTPALTLPDILCSYPPLPLRPLLSDWTIKVTPGTPLLHLPPHPGGVTLTSQVTSTQITLPTMKPAPSGALEGLSDLEDTLNLEKSPHCILHHYCSTPRLTIRPPLGRNLFPVQWVNNITASPDI